MNIYLYTNEWKNLKAHRVNENSFLKQKLKNSVYDQETTPQKVIYIEINTKGTGDEETIAENLQFQRSKHSNKHLEPQVDLRELFHDIL